MENREIILLEKLPIVNRKERKGRFRCFCGKEFITHIRSITRGSTTNCGCLKNKWANQPMCVDGRTKTRLYKIYIGMVNRTNNPKNRNYHKYGAKGIKVCEEWRDFLVFKEWAIANGYRDDLTLDRIEGHLGYGPDNCRWATPQEQARNTKKGKNRSSKYKGVSLKKGRGNIPRLKPWQAEATVAGKRFRLGMFEKEEEAAQAYIDFVKKHFGEYANYVPIDPPPEEPRSF